MTTFMSAATPATHFTASDPSVTVSGNLVTINARIASKAAVTVAHAGVCVSDAAGREVTFPTRQDAKLSPSPTSFSGTAHLGAGTYSYWPCVQVGPEWQKLGPSRSVVVSNAPMKADGPAAQATSGPTTEPSPTGSPTPQQAPPPAAAAKSRPPAGPASGVAMPVGNLPGWTQTFAEDFSVPLARGAFPGPYASKWTSYDGFKDTFGIAQYDKSVISVQGGYLDLYLHTQDGIARTAAPIPLVTGKWGGQVYGRFSTRMRADPLPAYKTAFLLWSDVDNWNDGEIDFPEGAIANIPVAHNHCVGNASKSCFDAESSVRYSDWHTYTIDWTPTRLSFYIDGALLGSTTTSIPTKPLHWVLQVESDEEVPASNVAGHLQVDWATVYDYTP
jgi:hypothetical protein